MDAIELFSKKGLKLGNYHYDVDRYENENGEVEVYLTRYYEECSECPLFDNGCDGESQPIFSEDYEKYPCSKMLPIEPYSQSYDFVDGFQQIAEYHEFTELERMALEMIWNNPNVMQELI